MRNEILSICTKKNIFGLFLALLIYTFCRLTFLKGLYNYSSNGRYDLFNFNILSAENYLSYNFSKVVVVQSPKWDAFALGLTNQLSRVVQLIEYGCKHNVYVSQKVFRLDFAVEKFGNLEDVIDIDKTNRNINCTMIIRSSDLFYFRNKQEIDGDQLDSHVGYWYSVLRDVNPLNYFHKLEFIQSPDTTWQSSENVPLPLKYYAMHFRIEMDMLIYFSDNDHEFRSIYFSWVDASRKNNDKVVDNIENRMIKIDANSTRILCFIQKYVNLVKEHFTDKSLPIILATSLGKKDVTNQKIEWILGYFRYRMTALGYTTLVGKATSKYRELNAVADTKMIRGAERCIVYNDSTFSYMASLYRSSQIKINKAPCSIVAFTDCVY